MVHRECRWCSRFREAPSAAGLATIHATSKEPRSTSLRLRALGIRLHTPHGRKSLISQNSVSCGIDAAKAIL